MQKIESFTHNFNKHNAYIGSKKFLPFEINRKEFRCEEFWASLGKVVNDKEKGVKVNTNFATISTDNDKQRVNMQPNYAAASYSLNHVVMTFISNFGELTERLFAAEYT